MEDSSQNESRSGQFSLRHPTKNLFSLRRAQFPRFFPSHSISAPWTLKEAKEFLCVELDHHRFHRILPQLGQVGAGRILELFHSCPLFPGCFQRVLLSCGRKTAFFVHFRKTPFFAHFRKTPFFAHYRETHIPTWHEEPSSTAHSLTQPGEGSAAALFHRWNHAPRHAPRHAQRHHQARPRAKA